MRTMHQAVACLAVLGYFVMAAQAGVVIEQEAREPGSTGPAQRTTLYIDAGKLRITGESGGGNFEMIFNQAQQVVWIIDRSRGTYYEMTAADVERTQQRMDQMRGKMEQAMKQMEAQMAQMPPEQRAMMERMMQGRMPSPQSQPARNVTVELKSRGEKMGPYVCNRYEVLTDGERTSEVWVAPLDQAQLQDAEYQTFRAMAEFYEPLSRNAPETKWGAPGSWQMEGFPVRWRSYEGQRVTSEWEVVKAERQALEPSLFTLPSGLQKTEMMPQQ